MKLCPRHLTGVSPGDPPFYNPGCERCEAKLAAGKVTAEPQRRLRKWRPQITPPGNNVEAKRRELRRREQFARWIAERS